MNSPFLSLCSSFSFLDSWNLWDFLLDSFSLFLYALRTIFHCFICNSLSDNWILRGFYKWLNSRIWLYLRLTLLLLLVFRLILNLLFFFHFWRLIVLYLVQLFMCLFNFLFNISRMIGLFLLVFWHLYLWFFWVFNRRRWDFWLNNLAFCDWYLLWLFFLKF